MFADWLDDRGEGSLAHALRWMGVRKKRPLKQVMFRTTRWTWFSSQKELWLSQHYNRTPLPENIDPALISILNPDRYYHSSSTFEGAVAALAFALDKLRHLYAAVPE